MAPPDSTLRRPDGIGRQHIELAAGTRHASLLSVLVLGAVVAAGLSGFAGGRAQTPSVATAAASLAVEMPSVIRVGQMLQTRVRVAARQPIDNLVIAVPSSLFDQITTNAMVPGAASESYDNGMWLLHFGKMHAGGAFMLQLSQQINPHSSGSDRGRVQVRDGVRVLAELPLEMKVLP